MSNEVKKVQNISLGGGLVMPQDTNEIFNPADIKVLVVEDSKIMAKYIRGCLEKAGYSLVFLSEDGQDAIDQAIEIVPNIILMDIQLPGKIDGIDAANQINSSLNVPIVYLTASVNEKILKRVKETAAFAYLMKPVKYDHLISNIFITLYKHKMQQDLVQSQEWLFTILNSIGDGVIATDCDGDIIFINPIAEQLTGWNHAEAEGEGLGVVFNVIDSNSSERLIYSDYEELQSVDSEEFSDSIVLVKKNGEQVPIEINYAPIKSDNENVKGKVFVFKDITERKEMEQELKKMAITDKLTGLYNRLGFNTLANQLIYGAKRDNKKLLLVFIDLDGMKVINDTFGHHEGDNAIKATAHILRETFREVDVISRMGGDEFVAIVLLDNDDNREVMFDRLRKNVEFYNRPKKRKYNISISVGYTYFNPEKPCSLDKLLFEADQMMYEHKQQKKKNFTKNFAEAIIHEQDIVSANE